MKNEALRLADRLENGGAIDAYACRSSTAAELRRLHAENDLLASAADKLRMSHSEERMELLRQRDQATAQRDELLAALKLSRAQWIHSVNSDHCLAAIKQAEENT